MGMYLNGPLLAVFVPALAIALVLAWLIVQFLRGRSARSRRNTEVFWFSSLHFFSKELSECSDPQQMVEQALHGALEMLD